MRVSCLMCFVRVPILRLGLFDLKVVLSKGLRIIDNIVYSLQCTFVIQNVLIRSNH